MKRIAALVIGTLAAVTVVALPSGAQEPADAVAGVDVEIVRSDQRTAVVRLTCPDRVDLVVEAQLWQRGRHLLGGMGERGCLGEKKTTVIMSPHITATRSGPEYPIRRLLAGPAELRVIVTARPTSAPFEPTTVTQAVTITEPALTEIRTSARGGVSLTVAPVELAADGTLTARVHVRCSRDRRLTQVTVTAYQDAPGATYRWLRGSQADVPCGQDRRLLRIELGAYDALATVIEALTGGQQPFWVLSAGAIEVVAEADRGPAHVAPVTIRPDQLDDEALPELIRPVRDAASIVGLGPIRDKTYRVAIDCPRSVDTVVIGTWAARRQHRIAWRPGLTILGCTAGRTLTWDLSYNGPTQGRVALHVASLGGPITRPTPSWEATQAGWRRPKSSQQPSRVE